MQIKLIIFTVHCTANTAYVIQCTGTVLIYNYCVMAWLMISQAHHKMLLAFV